MNIFTDFQKSATDVSNSMRDATIGFTNTVHAGTIDATKTLFEAANNLYQTYSSESVIETSDTESSEEEPGLFSSRNLQSVQRFELIKILVSSDKPKVLVIDKEISEPFFRHIISIPEVKSLDVKKIFYLDDVCITEKNYHYVYILRPNHKNTQYLKKLFDLNFNEKTLSEDSTHAIYSIPRDHYCMKQRIKEECSFNTILKMGNFDLNIFPISNDLLSIEQPKTLLKIIDDNDANPLVDIAQAISLLEKNYGTIPYVQYCGPNAEKVAKLIELPQLPKINEIKEDWEKEKNPTFARITLIDRTVDLITPLLTPSTFEGLIDEVMSISCNIIEIEKKWISKELHPFLKISKKATELEKFPIPLDKEYEIYPKLKDVNIANLKKAFDSIKESQNLIKNQIDSLIHPTSGLKPTAEEIREATELLTIHRKKTQWLAAYQSIALRLMDAYNDPEFQLNMDHEQNILLRIKPKETLEYIADLIQRKRPINQILRLLCLFSQVYTNNDKNSRYTIEESFFRNILQEMRIVYGESSVTIITYLEALGMLKSVNYGNKCDKYHLIQPLDTGICSTYGGYAPLSCRHIERMLKRPMAVKCKGLELVIFVGGCTRAEVAACRMISKKIVILTTSILNGHNFIESLRL